MQDKQIYLPYSFEPRDYQLPFLAAMDAGFKRAVIVWHRRSGKDKCVLQVVIKKMWKRVGTYYYFFPTYNQGRKVLWDGMDKDGFAYMSHFPEEIVANKNEQEMRIELTNGSAFQIIGCDNIDNIVGTNPIGVVFSEFPLGRPEAWDFIRPILAENEGWAIFDYTPRGMNHGWKLLQQAKAEDSWFFQVLTVEDTDAISREQLEQEKRLMPEDLFYQEYYCKFIEGAGRVFRNIDNCIYDDKYEPEQDHKFQIDTHRTYRLGVDLAKLADFTVITAIDLTTFKTFVAERFNQIDYPLQKARIQAQHFRFNKAAITIDSTGVGEPIYDDLNAAHIPVTGFKFTEQSRRDLLTNLQILLEQEIIKIPNDPILLDELRSFQYELSESGRVKMVVPDGLHDDMVMSLALAVWDLPNRPIPQKTESKKIVIKEFDYFKRLETHKPFNKYRK